MSAGSGMGYKMVNMVKQALWGLEGKGLPGKQCQSGMVALAPASLQIAPQSRPEGLCL